MQVCRYGSQAIRSGNADQDEVRQQVGDIYKFEKFELILSY